MSAALEAPAEAGGLIPIEIEVRGEVVTSNVGLFRDLVKTALAAINRELKTDEEFGQAELDVKTLKGAEDSIKSAKEKALADAESLHALFSELDATGEEIRKPRLELESLIKKRKEEVKAEIIADGCKAINMDAARVQRFFAGSIQEAIKGKRTLETMKSAVAAVAARHNIEIAKTEAIIAAFEKENGNDLVMDRRELEVKSAETVESELRRRLDLRKAQLENQRLAEEAAAAKAQLAAQQKESEPKVEPTPAPVATPAPSPAPAQFIPPVSRQPSAPAASSAPAVSESAEWEEFKTVCFAAAASMKAAREKLVHRPNQSKALMFSNALNAAWRGVA